MKKVSIASIPGKQTIKILILDFFNFQPADAYGLLLYTVVSDYDRSMPFYDYKTYRWTKKAGPRPENDILIINPLVYKHIKPVCAIYSTFLQRGYDQLIHDVALQNLHVVFAIDRAGLVGEDGPTHHNSMQELYKEVGLDAETLAEKIQEFCKVEA